MTATAGKKADIYVTSGAPIGMVNEAMTGDGTRTIYNITNPVKRYWDPGTPLVFQQSLDSGGTWNAVVPDVVQLAGGVITFVTPRQLSPLAQLRVSSGAYLAYTRMGGGHDWTFTPDVTLLEGTEFGMNSKFYVATALPGAKAQVKRWWADPSFQVRLGTRMVLVLYVDASAQPAGPRYEALAWLQSDALQTGVAKLNEEDLAFTADGDFYYRAT